MHYLVLNHWSKFQTKMTIYFGELGRAKKPPRSSLKIVDILSENEKMITNFYNSSLLVP